MSKHKIVTVYHDPITQRSPEGLALLISKIADLGDGRELWEVEFMNEPGNTYERIITAEKEQNA